MSNGEIIISVVTAVLVFFSLVVSIVIPKRDPNFPGRRNLVAFGLICAVLVGGTLAAIEVYGAEGHGAEAAHEGEHGEHEGEHGAGEGKMPPEEAPPPVELSPVETPGDLLAGAKVYAAAGCGSCHVLVEAGSTGTIGPDLDASQPSFELVVDRVTNGVGAMPAFAEQLTLLEIDDVAAYVVSATSD